ncbi:hypothetical protein FE782_22085 [Paenibacillus antri]|uniref:NlpC/P60 domain-containing protein n=1 Tax=Paenibacillus antri TaxID=2582848 RepID=A0A5R9G4Q7_9BACL|nr:C40 family peptidase [Paenibacillus antri]TLS50029.1 hypothetical protein FE782_22085 [Paenibacillus antri]
MDWTREEENKENKWGATKMGSSQIRIVKLLTAGAILLTSCNENGAQEPSTNANDMKNRSNVQTQNVNNAGATISTTTQQNEEYVELQELISVLGYQMANKNGKYSIGDTGVEYEIQMDQVQALKQGEPFSLSDAPKMIEGKPYLPITAVSDLFGEDMSYKFMDGQIQIAPVGEEGFEENADVPLYGDVYEFADDPTDPLRNVDFMDDAGVTDGNIQAQALKNISVNNMLRTARRYLGVRYVFGSEYPDDRTFDCSSYTQYVFAQHGIKLPRTARAQGKVGKTVSRRSLRKGDLLFFHIPGRFKSKNIPGHVGIYIGNGRMIHALNEPKDGVQYRSINIPFWRKNFLWAKRVAY